DQASDRKVPREGHKVTFTLGWEGKKAQYDKLETTTDAQGYASIAFYLQNPKENAERSFEDLNKYDPDKRPSAQVAEPADEGALINAANPRATGEITEEPAPGTNIRKALALVGPAATVRSVARLTIRNASVAATGGTIGEVAITGAASIGIIVAGGAAVIFTVKSGLDDMIAAQDKYNEDIDTRKPLQGKFDALDKEAAEPREELGVKRKCRQATPGNIRAAVLRSEMKTLQPSISSPGVQTYVDMIENGLLPSPIKTAGDLIVDGNHRYIAGLLCGIEVDRTPGTAPLSLPRYPIRQIKIDELDWRQ
ncbi:MAG: hypothetical protein COV48_01995, partial [Elusimicrobia bacterium CG11_big_fil_rev_8_21_14_0_20_64_6]